MPATPSSTPTTLDGATRDRLETQLGADLSDVRCHTDAVAHAVTTAMGADAVTVGSDVFFAPGRLRPDTRDGLALLAHEIAHVLQQRRADASQRPEVGAHADAWERHADDVARRVVAGETVRDAEGPGGPVPLVQCHSSFEHRMLGDVAAAQLDAGEAWPATLQTQIDLLWEWNSDPLGVTEADVHRHCPGLPTLRLEASGLLVTYGELNALPDYIANAAVADTLPAEVLLPILQFIRQEGFIKLNALRGVKTSKAFAGAVARPHAILPGLINTILESLATDKLTRGLGINGEDHYSAVLGRNACHFAPYSWHRWHAAHAIARDLATRAHAARDSGDRARLTHEALLHVGYADHFLQDSFAAGHLVNKTLIMQWFVEWAAGQSRVPVAEWQAIKTMTTALQPGLAGRGLYNDVVAPSNDPQTAVEQPTYLARLQATGLVPGPGEAQETTYQRYLAFLSSLITQSSSAAIHDHYNAVSLKVSSETDGAYEVWGDDTLFSGADWSRGARITGEVATMSRTAVQELVATGRTDITVDAIAKRLPTKADDGTGLVPLEQWNDSQKTFCEQRLFPKLHDIIVRATAPSIANVSRDQDLAVEWSASLPKAGFDLTNVLRVNGTLFCASVGRVYALDPTTGRVLGEQVLSNGSGPAYETRLTSDGKRLYMSVHGQVSAAPVDDITTLDWTVRLPDAGGTTVDLITDNGALYAGTNGHVYQLSPDSGQVMHHLSLRSLIGLGDYTTTLRVHAGMLLAGTHGWVYGIDPSDWSAHAWATSLGGTGYNLVDLLVANAGLYAGTNGFVFELDPTTGAVRQSRRMSSIVGAGNYTTRLATDGTRLFAGTHGWVYGMPLDDLSAGWQMKLASGLASLNGLMADVDVAADSDQLLVGTSGHLIRLAPTTGAVQGDVLLSSVIGIGDYGTHLVLSPQGGHAYVGCHGYAYGVTLEHRR